MTRYVALLRGINVSGKNKIAMAELKEGFAELGYRDAATCLNSGNVAFSAEEGDGLALSGAVRAMVRSRFGLDVPVFVITQEELRDILAHAPDWWGGEDREIYDNLIFLLPPLTHEGLVAEIGEPRAGYEQACPYKNAVFWSFVRKDYQKTNWWSGTAGANVRDALTIRTANTVRKIAGL